MSAEGVGFEPTEPVKAQHLSRVLLSAAQPSFHCYFFSLSIKPFNCCLKNLLPSVVFKYFSLL